MLGVFGRWAVAISLFLVSLASASTVLQDSRDGRRYHQFVSGKLIWFSGNLNFSKRGMVQGPERISFYSPEALASACPEGSRVPDIVDWNALAEDRFSGPRRRQNVKAFAGNTHGYLERAQSSETLKGGENAFFAVVDTNGNKAMLLDLRRGDVRLISMPDSAAVPVRCVADRDFFAEKNIDKDSLVYTDPRDGIRYKVDVREEKVWMKSNLRFGMKSAKQCFMEDTLYCKRHGRFFTHSEAMNACPAGWHLPDDAEWRDYQRDRGNLDWNNLGRGGCRDWDGYCDEGSTGHYWSATSIKRNTGRSWEFRREAHSINRTDESFQKGLYVRCVTDLK